MKLGGEPTSYAEHVFAKLNHAIVCPQVSFLSLSQSSKFDLTFKFIIKNENITYYVYTALLLLPKNQRIRGARVAWAPIK